MNLLAVDVTLHRHTCRAKRPSFGILPTLVDQQDLIVVDQDFKPW